MQPSCAKGQSLSADATTDSGTLQELLSVALSLTPHDTPNDLER
jgi:hypothetical protein